MPISESTKLENSRNFYRDFNESGYNCKFCVLSGFEFASVPCSKPSVFCNNDAADFWGRSIRTFLQSVGFQLFSSLLDSHFHKLSIIVTHGIDLKITSTSFAKVARALG